MSKEDLAKKVSMKNCESCSHMKVKIAAGESKSFRLYKHRGYPKPWVEANSCVDYNEVDLVKELGFLIIQANEMLGNL